mmetsp:Transcript_109974/g.350205  ORF Transcript_109974/g.350205 Transcript_109974/m.350205 type:complete len:275 (-) Transcript_109974:320-1144(-)
MPRWEVPVSTTPRQVPSLQMSSSTPLMRTAKMLTCQWPCSGITTGAQDSGSSSLRSSTPPKATSESSPSSPSVRKMPNCEAGRPFPRSISKKLNSLFSARPSRPRPRMPSKRKVLKGAVDISTARMTLISTHISVPPLLSAAPSATTTAPASIAEAASSVLGGSVLAPTMPKQTMSFVNSPVISPVPKPMVTWSQCSPSGTNEPSELMATEVSEADMLNLRRPSTMQASVAHSAAGSTKCPEPVSKTTRNSCAGVPRVSTPEYEVLNEAIFPLR